MPVSSVRRTPVGLAILLVITGVSGLVAAFALTLDKIAILQNPNAALGCNFSVLVQCGANLDSPEGAVFGFPNPLIGIAGYAIVTVVGVAVLAGARFANWFWALFNLGLLFAIGFVAWLITQSLFVLGTLCPWCMLVWAVTIPLSLAVTVQNVRAGVLPLPRGPRRAIGAAYGWLPFITLLCYLVIAVVAQVRLDVLSQL